MRKERIKKRRNKTKEMIIAILLFVLMGCEKDEKDETIIKQSNVLFESKKIVSCEKKLETRDSNAIDLNYDSNEWKCWSDSVEDYLLFLQGDRTAKRSKDYVEDIEFLGKNILNIDESYSIDNMIEIVKWAEDERYVQEVELSYAYIDCGRDGKPDLLIKIQYGLSNYYFVIEKKDDLEIMLATSGHSKDFCFFGEYGSLHHSYSNGAISAKEDVYETNKDGVYYKTYGWSGSYGLSYLESENMVKLNEMSQLLQEYYNGNAMDDMENLYCQEFNIGGDYYYCITLDKEKELYDIGIIEMMKNEGFHLMSTEEINRIIMMTRATYGINHIIDEKNVEWRTITR